MADEFEEFDEDEFEDELEDDTDDAEKQYLTFAVGNE